MTVSLEKELLRWLSWQKLISGLCQIY